MSKNELERHLTEELLWDAEVDDAAIAVSAHDAHARGPVLVESPNEQPLL